jgi:hypothetical protein
MEDVVYDGSVEEMIVLDDEKKKLTSLPSHSYISVFSSHLEKD